MTRGVIALLGSGEIAPGMVKVHRQLLARHQPVRAINLDTPYGFQENVPQVTGKILEYFDTSLRIRIEDVSLPDVFRASPRGRAQARAAVRSANYVLAGPGSPTYALRQWRELGLLDDLRAVLAADGTLVLASAAALTVGSHTAPIYEVYKAGLPAIWHEGLDLLGDLGLHCAVIPHFDNAEGRNYDTRYCYLGESRLRQLESELPPEVGVLGIDEHTALILDLASDAATVLGRGSAHWRHNGTVVELESASTTPLDALRSTDTTPREQIDPPAPADVAAEMDREDIEISRVNSLVEEILALRTSVRERREFALADHLRTILEVSGIEVNDGPKQVTWRWREH